MFARIRLGRLSLLLAVLGCLLATTAGAASISLPLNPTAGYLRADSTDAPTTPGLIDLQALGIVSGQTIQLQGVGTFQFCSDISCSDDGTTVGGIFSSSANLLSQDNLNRVAGAIDAGDDLLTGSTFYELLANDIPEDFEVSPNGVSINVPDGAQYLMLGVIDSFWADNVDPNADLAVVLTYTPADGGVPDDVPEPVTSILWSTGLASLVGLRVISQRRRP